MSTSNIPTTSFTEAQQRDIAATITRPRATKRRSVLALPMGVDVHFNVFKDHQNNYEGL